MNAHDPTDSAQCGATITEAVLSLAILAITAIGFGTAVSNSQGSLKIAGAASELATLRAAGDRYVQDNFSTLVASAAAGPIAIPVATLASQNYLPPSFPASNAYGQAYQLYVRERSPTVLESVALTTGGTAMSGSDGGRIALLLKGSGGFTPVGSSTINGTNGAWSAPLATYVPASAPKPSGNPAAYSIQYAVMGPTGALIRYATGNPADNQMQTTLAMGGNNITGAGNVAAQTVSLPVGGTVSMGSSYLYGDNSNAAIRQNAGFYVQDLAGNTKFNTDNAGDSWQPGNHTAGSMNASSGSFTNLSSNSAVSNALQVNGAAAAATLALNGGNSLTIGGSIYYGDGTSNASRQWGGFYIQDPNGNTRWQVDNGGNSWQPGNMAAGNGVHITGGGVQFADGTVQTTAASAGSLGVVRQSPAMGASSGPGTPTNNNFYCDAGYQLQWLHYDCGCTNNATWAECIKA